jgi:hypothetical protein
VKRIGSVGGGVPLVEGRGLKMKEGQIYFKGGTRYCHAGLNLSAKLVATCQGLDSLVANKSGGNNSRRLQMSWVIVLVGSEKTFAA